MGSSQRHGLGMAQGQERAAEGGVGAKEPGGAADLHALSGELAAGGRRGYNGNMGTGQRSSQAPQQTGPEPSGAIRAAAEYGIDIEMLRANVALTPAERLRRHQIALNTVEMLRKAKRA